MTPIAHLLVFVAVFVVVYWIPGAVFQAFCRSEERFEKLLSQDPGWAVSPRVLVIASWAGGAVLSLLIATLTHRFILAILIGAGAYMAPSLWLVFLLRQRKQKLEEQIMDLLPSLASSLRAGLTLPQAMEDIISSLSWPMRTEISRTVQDYRMGRTLSEAIEGLGRRSALESFRVILTAIEICFSQGGDLPSVLDTITAEFREIDRVERQARALSAEARLQAKLMAFAPFVLAGLLYLGAPDLWANFADSPIGVLVLSVASLMIIGAIAWMRRIVAFQI